MLVRFSETISLVIVPRVVYCWYLVFKDSCIPAEPFKNSEISANTEIPVVPNAVHPAASPHKAVNVVEVVAEIRP